MAPPLSALGGDKKSSSIDEPSEPSRSSSHSPIAFAKASPVPGTPTLSYADAAAVAPIHEEVLAAQIWDILTALLMLRLCSAFCVRTFFQPDEYFQALEPAWQLAFGPASGAWLTWEWRHKLRTSLHPVLFAGVYIAVDAVLALLHAVGPLRAIVLVAVPSVAQAVITAIGDFYVWRLAGQLYGHDSNATWAALWLCIVSPWQWYCGTRTFSNGLETALTAAALAYWPWQLFGHAAVQTKTLFADGGLKRFRLSLFLAATAVILRPTNLLIWGALLSVAVTRLTLDEAVPAAPAKPAPRMLSLGVVARLAIEAVGCGSAVLALSAVSDRLYYGVWTLPAYTFLDINLTQDVAVFYGSNPWHYYLSQGLPLLALTSLPFALYGIYAALVVHQPAATTAALASTNALRALAFAVVASVASLSLVAHKEVRFLYPLLPVLNVLAAPHVVSFFTVAVEEDEPSSVPAALPSAPSSLPPPPPTTVLRRKGLLAAALTVNALVAGYLSLAHQPAPLSVLTFLRHEYERIHHDWLEMAPADLPAFDTYPDAFFRPAIPGDGFGDGDELFALFLTPCHSTPWRSHLVYPGLRARALTCEPPLSTAPGSPERAAYLDEADRFYAEPNRFLATEMWPVVDADAAEASSKTPRRTGEVPRYIVAFEGLEPVLTDFFASHNVATGGAGLGVTLRRVWTGWNGLFNEDWRRRGALVVWDTGVFSNASHPDAESGARFMDID